MMAQIARSRWGKTPWYVVTEAVTDVLKCARQRRVFTVIDTLLIAGRLLHDTGSANPIFSQSCAQLASRLPKLWETLTKLAAVICNEAWRTEMHDMANTCGHYEARDGLCLLVAECLVLFVPLCGPYRCV